MNGGNFENLIFRMLYHLLLRKTSIVMGTALKNLIPLYLRKVFYIPVVGENGLATSSGSVASLWVIPAKQH